MDEVRKSLRYVLPGLCCVMILLIALLVSDFCSTEQILNGISKDNGIGAAIIVLLGSGAIGFLLAHLYFALIWRWPFKGWAVYDYTMILDQMVNEGAMKILGNDGSPIKITDKRQAWEMMNIFFTFEEITNVFERYREFQQALVTHTHAIGATMLGFVLIIPTWGIIYFYQYGYSFEENLVVSFAVPGSIVALIVVLGMAYKQVLSTSERVANSVLASYLRNEAKNKPANTDPKEITYFSRK